MTEPRGTQQEIWLSASCGRQIAEHLFLRLPHEACGVLRGKAAAGGMRIDTFIPMRNVAPDPLHRFTLHPEDWTKECLRGEGLLGLFHSHPHSEPVPSEEDVRQLPLFADMLSVYLVGSPRDNDGTISLNGYMIHRETDAGYSLRPCPIRHG